MSSNIPFVNEMSLFECYYKKISIIYNTELHGKFKYREIHKTDKIKCQTKSTNRTNEKQLSYSRLCTDILRRVISGLQLVKPPT